MISQVLACPSWPVSAAVLVTVEGTNRLASHHRGAARGRRGRCRGVVISQVLACLSWPVSAAVLVTVTGTKVALPVTTEEPTEEQPEAEEL